MHVRLYDNHILRSAYIYSLDIWSSLVPYLLRNLCRRYKLSVNKIVCSSSVFCSRMSSFGLSISNALMCSKSVFREPLGLGKACMLFGYKMDKVSGFNGNTNYKRALTINREN